MQQVLGGEVIAAMLAAEGVDTVFGIVDGTYMGLYSSSACSPWVAAVPTDRCRGPAWMHLSTV